MNDAPVIIAPCPGPCDQFYDLWAKPSEPTPLLCEDCLDAHRETTA